MEGAEVKEVVREQVLLGNSAEDRISCSGPVLIIDAQSAVHVALILHELATNARKYGALSVPNGRLSISWELRTDSGRALFLNWAERGVPEVHAPTGSGFGTTLIEQIVRGCGGEARMHYDAGGVTAELRLPLPEPERTDAPGRAAETRNRAGLSVVPQQDEQRSLSGKRILVVEDEALISLDLETRLSTAGCEVIGPAATLELARRLVANAQFDAALVDANLAGHPVDELAIALTQRNVPFAFVTGYGREVLPYGFREAVVLAKPFSQDQLLATVQAILTGPGVIPLRRKAN
jgi:CheY-like chemotaxis protein